MLKYLKLFVDVVLAIPIGLFIASFVFTLTTGAAIFCSLPAIFLTIFLFRLFHVPHMYDIYAVIGWIIFHDVVIFIKYHFDSFPKDDYGVPKI